MPCKLKSSFNEQIKIKLDLTIDVCVEDMKYLFLRKQTFELFGIFLVFLVFEL
jgi:hypothetical protein